LPHVILNKSKDVYIYLKIIFYQFFEPNNIQASASH